MITSLRQFTKQLRDEGWVETRNTKHNIWKHPDGRTLSLPHSPHDGIKTYLIHHTRGGKHANHYSRQPLG